MTHAPLVRLSARWFRLLLRLYPVDFRDDMGDAIVASYCDRTIAARQRRGVPGLAAVWMRAFVDAAVNGPAEHLRPAAMWRRAGHWGRDLATARRRVTREPLFVAATVATLAVGLGAFAVVYTAVDKILLEPLPYRAPDQLYWVWRSQTAAAGLARDWLSGPDVDELQRAGGVIEAVAGIQLFAPTLSANRDSESMQIALMRATPNLFELLGVAPALGTTFAAREAGPGEPPPVVILSHRIWTRLGSDPSIVGRTVWMSGGPYTVLGVMPSHFRFARHGTVGAPQEADVYVPVLATLASQNPNATGYGALIRVAPSTSHQQVMASVSAAGRAVNERHRQNRPFELYAVGLHADLVARVRPVLFALGLAGAFLLLVLTVNLASLLLARAAARDRELAVSRAVGASGAAIARAMLAEGVFLGLAGGVAGSIAGRWGTRLLVTLAPTDLPRLDTLALDWGVAAAVVVTGGLLGAIAALVPAMWASRVSLSALVVNTSLRGGASVTPMRRVMIVAQVAISLVLLCAGGLVVRSFERLLAAEPGFRPDGVLTFTVAMGPRLFPKSEEVERFQDRLEAALRRLPGVTGVSATTALPLSANAGQATITMPGAPGNNGDQVHDTPMIDLIPTRVGYQELIGMTLLAGRGFDPPRGDNVKEAIIDASLARQFYPSSSPLGATVTFNGAALTIVGVATQARLYDMHEDGRPQVYVRAADWPPPYTPSFVIRGDGNLDALTREAPRTVRQVDPRIAVSSMRTMDEIVDDAMRQPRISAVLIAGFAAGALLLVAMGLFGMIAGAVSQRRSELAVRLALGATHSRVLRLVVGEGAGLVAIGMLIAGPGVYAAGVLLRGLLIGVSPLDPIALASAAAGLAAVSISACYLPARRVLRIDPSPLLRE